MERATRQDECRVRATCKDGVGITTLSTRIYLYMTSAPSLPNVAAALSVVLMIVTSIFVFAQRPAAGRQHRVRLGPRHGLPQLPDVVNAGKLGVDVSDAQGYATARAVALPILTSLKAHFGDLDRVKRVIRLFGMVNCSPEFAGHAHIIDGASDLYYALFGPEYGCHARSAVGMMSLPRQIAVEINGEFEIHP